MARFAILRKDYNKPNRCPAWSGPGMDTVYPWERKRADCRGGSSGIYADNLERGLKASERSFHRCATCGTRTWPYALRRIDPLYILGKLTKWKLG